jgi:hypothetical protein
MRETYQQIAEYLDVKQKRRYSAAVERVRALSVD